MPPPAPVAQQAEQSKRQNTQSLQQPLFRQQLAQSVLQSAQLLHPWVQPLQPLSAPQQPEDPVLAFVTQQPGEPLTDAAQQPAAAQSLQFGGQFTQSNGQHAWQSPEVAGFFAVTEEELQLFSPRNSPAIATQKKPTALYEVMENLLLES